MVIKDVPFNGRTSNLDTLKGLFCNASVIAACLQKQGEREAAAVDCVVKKCSVDVSPFLGPT